MAYVPVPKDLNAVKTKVLLNLTKRQLICFGAGAALGVPLFFLLKAHTGISTAAICMILLMLPFFHGSLFWPNPVEWFFLLTCSLSGILGQYCLTYGFLYVTAVEGAVISSSRILLAALLGPMLVADPALTLAGWAGALIIFAANVALALRRPAPAR